MNLPDTRSMPGLPRLPSRPAHGGPRITIDEMPTVAGWAVQCLLAACALAATLLSWGWAPAAGVWVAFAVVLVLVLRRPGGLAPVGLVGFIVVALVTHVPSGGWRWQTHALVLVLHVFLRLCAVATSLRARTRVETGLLLGEARAMLPAQLAGQVLAGVAAAVAALHAHADGLRVVALVTVLMLMAIVLPRAWIRGKRS